MQLHTMHMVLTLKPCLVVGGHFYSGCHVNQTLHGKQLQAYHQDALTNTSHYNTVALLH